MYYYNSLNTYLKERFNTKVYKLAVSCNFTCPNRDGTKGTGGCIFCSSGGSGEFAAKGESVKEQIALAKEKIASKVKCDCKYICYFQAFTNTYAPIEKLRKLFYEAVSEEDVVAVSIATRPDCLDEDVVLLLAELNKIKPVFVELGLQTSNENTAKLINRCYENHVFSEAVKRLRKSELEVITHVILGLPGETVQDMLNSVSFACACGIDGIKLQLLHVLKGTKLAQMDYKSLTMDEYFFALAECLKIIPKNVVIHRLTGDGDKRILISPLWSADKHNVLNKMKEYFDKNNVIQGINAEN